MPKTLLLGRGQELTGWICCEPPWVSRPADATSLENQHLGEVWGWALSEAQRTVRPAHLTPSSPPLLGPGHHVALWTAPSTLPTSVGPSQPPPCSAHSVLPFSPKVIPGRPTMSQMNLSRFVSPVSSLSLSQHCRRLLQCVFLSPGLFSLMPYSVPECAQPSSRPGPLQNDWQPPLALQALCRPTGPGQGGGPGLQRPSHGLLWGCSPSLSASASCHTWWNGAPFAVQGQSHFMLSLFHQLSEFA